MITRGYKRHTSVLGVAVRNTVLEGYSRLNVMTESIKSVSWYQQEYEKPHDKRRRRQKESEFKKYVEYKKSQVERSVMLRRKTLLLK